MARVSERELKAWKRWLQGRHTDDLESGPTKRGLPGSGNVAESIEPGDPTAVAPELPD